MQRAFAAAAFEGLLGWDVWLEMNGRDGSMGSVVIVMLDDTVQTALKTKPTNTNNQILRLPNVV